ncbi:hypothetical protein F383_34465 [Gossypium arboreum]|uniref:Uncharacterized protein n=1 Tax=Gossypium arboreum TaxID=29729 RepID=A0A0B0MGW2_GOSAR|nr:hypothetical protein F383_37238 [Gossypium arboreum]KHG07327.1 hypothetical protein F383_34465 [Gossypium arboreum]
MQPINPVHVVAYT